MLRDTVLYPVHSGYLIIFQEPSDLHWLTLWERAEVFKVQHGTQTLSIQTGSKDQLQGHLCHQLWEVHENQETRAPVGGYCPAPAHSAKCGASLPRQDGLPRTVGSDQVGMKWPQRVRKETSSGFYCGWGVSTEKCPCVGAGDCVDWVSQESSITELPDFLIQRIQLWDWSGGRRLEAGELSAVKHQSWSCIHFYTCWFWL